MLTQYKCHLHTFKSPHPMPDTRDLLVQVINVHTATRDAAGRTITMNLLHVPPMIADIYYSTVKDDQIVITAGNRFETYWQITFDLSELPGGGVYGEANLDRRRRDVRMWMGNINEINMICGDLARLCSFDILSHTW